MIPWILTFAFDFDLMLGSFLTFWVLMSYFWGWGRVGKLFGVYSCSCLTFILYVFVNSGIGFYLILWSFFTFRGPNRLLFGVEGGFDICFGVYSCSWTTFMVYVSFKSDVWFWLNFGVNFYFSGPYWAFVLSSCTTVSVVDSSPEMLPPGYFVSTGSCFQRCPNWLFRLFWRISKCILCSPRAPQSPL